MASHDIIACFSTRVTSHKVCVLDDKTDDDVTSVTSSVLDDKTDDSDAE